MSRCLKAVILLLMILPCFSGSVYAGEVTERIKITLEKVINILNDPELKKDEMAEQRKSVLHNVLKEVFDEEEFARRSLKGHWGGLSEKEKKEFTFLFTDLLETTYFDKIDTYVKEAGNFSTENISYVNEKVKGRFAVVGTKIDVGSNGSLSVDYRMINKNGNWMVCDLVIEGVSVVKNYRAQFNEIGRQE